MSKSIPLPRINLPAVTFLCGGPLAIRSLIAHHLDDSIQSAQAHSFAAPIRDGVLGTFFSGDPSIDIEALDSHPIFPDPDSPTFGAFIAAFSQFLPSFFSNPAIIGRLAARRIEENKDYFDHFIFDDADTKENIKLIADIFGRDKALIINFGPPYLLSKSIRVIDLPTPLPDPISILEYLASQLNPAPVVDELPRLRLSKDPLDGLL